MIDENKEMDEIASGGTAKGEESARKLHLLSGSIIMTLLGL
jgi:hypothetical protein